MSKVSNSFLHDSNSRNEEKILKLRAKYGMEGYGCYYLLLEMLREADDCELNLDFEFLAFALSANAEKIEQIVKYSIELGLFTISNNKFFSNGLKKRVEAFEKKREVYKENANKRFKKINTSELVEPLHSNGIAMAEPSECQSINTNININENINLKTKDLKKIVSECFFYPKQFQKELEELILNDFPEPDIEFFKENACVQSEKYPLIFISAKKRENLIATMAESSLSAEDFPDVLEYFQNWAEEKNNSKLSTERRKYQDKKDHALCIKKWAIPAVAERKRKVLDLKRSINYLEKSKEARK